MTASRIAAAGLLLAVSSTFAGAQTSGENLCEAFIPGNENGQFFAGGYFNTCGASQLSRINTIYIPSVLQHVIAGSFGFGPIGVEPAGMSGIGEGDAAQRLSPSTLIISSTSDMAAAAAPSPVKWNAWADGRYLHSDYAVAAGDTDGPTVSGLAGLDYKLTSKFSLGLLISADKSDLESALTDLKTNSLGVGPYIGIVLTDNLVFSGNFLATRIASEQLGGALEFDTDRLQASAALNGYWYKGNWRFTPGLTFAWSKDWEEEVNALVPDRTIEVGVLTPALQVGNTLKLSDKSSVEPWIGAALDWTLINDTHTSGAGTVSDSNTDLRLQAGLNFNFSTNAQLAITGEAAGLLLDDVDSYSVEANLAIQF